MSDEFHRAYRRKPDSEGKISIPEEYANYLGNLAEIVESDNFLGLLPGKRGLSAITRDIATDMKMDVNGFITLKDDYVIFREGELVKICNSYAYEFLDGPFVQKENSDQLDLL